MNFVPVATGTKDEYYFTTTPDGTPMGMVKNDTPYYYVTNLQGDVVAIVNHLGYRVVQYTYDAWGNVLSITGARASTIGAENPIRYRGYVYDTETRQYYISSRYYNPDVGRWLSPEPNIYMQEILIKVPEYLDAMCILTAQITQLILLILLANLLFQRFLFVLLLERLLGVRLEELLEMHMQIVMAILAGIRLNAY